MNICAHQQSNGRAQEPIDFCSNAAFRVLHSGGNDRVVKIWNTADGKPVPELKGHELEVRKFDGKDLHTYNSGQHVHFGGVRSLAAYGGPTVAHRRWAAHGAGRGVLEQESDFFSDVKKSLSRRRNKKGCSE